MKIATPIITDFDKEDIAPWSGNRLIELHMATLPSKIIKPFIFMPTNKHSLYYQKLRPRFEPRDEITQAVCPPKCQEGWYFDCDSESCKEFDFHPSIHTKVIQGGIMIGYNLWEATPVGNGLHSISISEGWYRPDYMNGPVIVRTKTVDITETCWLGHCTIYRPAGMPNPFKTGAQLISDHMEDFKNSVGPWIADMRRYDYPNAIVDNEKEVSFSLEPNSDDELMSNPIRICYQYYFSNLPAKYVGQEHELAISILRSKYGFRI